MTEAPDWGFTNLAPSTRWLLAYGLPTTAAPPTRPLDDPSWTTLRSQARSHRLQGHLIAAVVNGSFPVTEQQRSDVAALEIEASKHRIRYDEVCLPVLQALDAARIPTRLIKGSSLPWCDYPDPQLRPTGDLDLLVPGSRLLEAAQLLKDMGGTALNPEPTDGYALKVFKGLTITMPSGLEVDLHRILSWGPLGIRVPEADLWAPGRSFDRLGRRHVTLDRERTLLHMCAHLLLLGALRASEVRDVAQLATAADLDADKTVTIAERWGQQALLAVALRMAERELSLQPDAYTLAQWARSYRVSLRDRAWLRVDRPDAPVRGIEPFAVFVELPTWDARSTMARALIAPRPGTDPSFTSRIRGIVASIAPDRRRPHPSPRDARHHGLTR